jgi:hypothetical protein
MTSVNNLFSNIGFLKDENYDNYGFTSTPSLNQGEKYQKYQNKIKDHLEKRINNVNSREGFSDILNNLSLDNNGLTYQTTNVLENNDFSAQDISNNQLKTDYTNTLNEYKTLTNEINIMTNDYLSRVHPTNIYLNKIVRFKTGQTAYVTNQGVLKYIPSTDILNSINVSKTFTEIDMSWNNSWSIPGITIPTVPNLLSGTPMRLNQSVGNEGTNVYVSNLSKVAYVDENATLYEYPIDNVEYSNNYTTMTGTNSNGYDISGASYSNATVEACKNTCNSNFRCAGFSFLNNTCYPKTSDMHPTGTKQSDNNSTLYLRNKKPIRPPMGASSVVNNVDTIAYTNYNLGTNMNTQYGLKNVTGSKQTQLSELRTKLNDLTSRLISLTEKYDAGTYQANAQSTVNIDGVNDYLNKINNNNSQIKGVNSNVIENILKDSDIIVLQKNYNYLFWSILAVSTVLISMNIAKK